MSTERAAGDRLPLPTSVLPHVGDGAGGHALMRWQTLSCGASGRGAVVRYMRRATTADPPPEIAVLPDTTHGQPVLRHVMPWAARMGQWAEMTAASTGGLIRAVGGAEWVVDRTEHAGATSTV